MIPSQNCLKIIKFYEGFRTRAYKCPRGIPTIGYGSTRWFNRPGQPAVKLGETITEADASVLLEYTVMVFADEISRYINVPINQNQFDALVSFVYNVGTENFRKSILLKLLNAGDYEGCAKQFDRWNRSGGIVLEGLKNRRRAEKALFQLPCENF